MDTLVGTVALDQESLPAEAASSDPEDFYPSPGRIPLDQRGRWHTEFAEDLGRYRAHHGGSAVKPLLLEQGLWALLQYRLASAVYRSSLPAPVRLPLIAVCILTQKLTEIVTGVSLPFQSQIYPGQYLGHFGPVVVNRDAVIGAGCNLSQGVTIGVSGRGERRGVPVIGPRVYFGANAVVAGAISVGSDAVIAGNTLVTQDVPDCATMAGVPARLTDRRGTTGMGLHQRPRITAGRKAAVGSNPG